jgi:CRP-like cAMP-binding protein
MVSPELCRRYAFFRDLSDEELRNVAMVSDEITAVASDVLFETEQPATALYLLVSGDVELWFVAVDRHEQDLRKEFYLSDVNPGEILGISALVEPYLYTSSARVTGASRLIKINAPELRHLCRGDCRLDAAVMHQVARAAMERLNDTRVQLLAARA